MVASVDKDGRGVIDFNQFRSMISGKISLPDNNELLMQVFNTIDQDNDVKLLD